MNTSRYISQFVEDKAGFQAWLERNAAIARPATEMCEALNLKLRPVARLDSDRNVVGFLTDTGMLAGELKNERIYSGARSGDNVFRYKGPRVSKDRGRDKDTREAVKITGIISSLKKNDEVPTHENLMKNELHAVRYAFSVTKNEREAHYGLDMTQQMQAALLRAYFDKNYDYIEANKEKYDEHYSKLLKAEEKIRRSKGVFDRFAAGSTAIGVRAYYNGYGDDELFYLVGRASFDMNTPRFDMNTPRLENVVRYNSLLGSPVAADAAIIRTYMQGQSHEPLSNNELGIRKEDKYYYDIDVSLGFASGDGTVWLLIPDAAE